MGDKNKNSNPMVGGSDWRSNLATFNQIGFGLFLAGTGLAFVLRMGSRSQ